MIPSRWMVRPAVVEAAQVTAETAEEVAHWVGGRVSYVEGEPHGVACWSLTGRSLYVPLGAWLIRQPDGGYSALGDDAFLAAHEPEGAAVRP